ncbi:MAG TPA: hypothetical protein VFQ53_02030 [Kofleriaceae bacterium]|nr:hypothetical protein [Kofleriaceae bacterium]
MSKVTASRPKSKSKPKPKPKPAAKQASRKAAKPANPGSQVAMLALRSLALAHPGAEDGVACAGTAMERHTVKANGKAFLFVGATDALVKLDGCLAEAREHAARQPARYRIGANGWVKLVFAADVPPPLAMLARWTSESYALVAAPKPARSKGRA